MSIIVEARIRDAIAVNASAPAKARAAGDAWMVQAQKLHDLGANTPERVAQIIGQCGHESASYRTMYENLNYSGAALWRVFKRHFSSQAEADSFARQPERIANRVYSNRMENGTEASGDGWRYRGRGYLQLTGKSNYRIYGEALGLDLLNDPEAAATPEVAWQIAVRYCATRTRSGKTLMQWADERNTRMVTLGINGGLHGLSDRLIRVDKAMNKLEGGYSVADQQSLLLDVGFMPGPVDGLMGAKTRAAIQLAEAHYNLTGDALFDHLGTPAAQPRAFEILEMQQLLMNVGINPGPIDGMMGSRTRKAIRIAEERFRMTGDLLFEHLSRQA